MGIFYSEPNYSFLPTQKSYLSGKWGLIFNQINRHMSVGRYF